jgi:hypothetical protein
MFYRTFGPIYILKSSVLLHLIQVSVWHFNKTEFNANGSGNWEGINFNRWSFQISMFYRTFGPIYILKSSVLLHFCRLGPTVFGKSEIVNTRMRDMTSVKIWDTSYPKQWLFNRKSHMHMKVSLLSEFKSHINLSLNDNFSKLEWLMLFLIVSRSLRLEV